MKNRKKFIAAIICVMIMGLTACAGGKEEVADSPKQVEPLVIEMEDTEQSSDIQEQADTQIQESEENEDEELDEKLDEYREYRETVTAVPMGNGVTGSGNGPMKNPEDFGFSFDASASENFDVRELTEGFETGKNYVENILGISVETKHTVYMCVDPRIWAIYEAEDKGVADGYEPENIFVCEYSDNGSWQYLILVREGKGSAWEVIHHGSSYMED